MRLPSKDSATFRAIVTGAQALGGFMVFALILLRSVNVDQLSTSGYPQLAGGVTVAIGVLSFITNFLRKDVNNY